MVVKLTLLGTLIVSVFSCLRGHDMLTGLALLLLFLFAVVAVLSTIISRRGGSSASGGGSGSSGLPMPMPKLPGGWPPTLAAAIEVRR
ncbi:MAG: hypothetical protein JWM68_2756 [Verrucomicrobiales bacterium]|nr:hypothetical protein [Verrucomicrobiales bacterium]